MGMFAIVILSRVVLENSASTKFSVYPNPSSGIVGIKFDNTLGGEFKALIYNTQGQMTVNKDIVVSGFVIQRVSEVVAGVHWLGLPKKKP
jgi:hypothetical protein